MKFIADFHIHSKYSRATSRSMNVPVLTQWAKRKGITLLGTGDFTHHLWLQELKQHLEDTGNGLYAHEGVNFILTAEISSIYSQNKKVYRVHNMIMAPSFAVAEEINKMLAAHGNIASDGRPILGMSCKLLAKEVFKISNDIMFVPAHIWTPWFSVFGSNSGFDRLEDAFDTYTDKITALETGLSSDPAMNWMVSALDKYSLISNSDAHSPANLGREANIFDCALDYWEIKRALEKKDKEKFLYTVEFFPEEGKYHFDGHRNCKVRFHPSETRKHSGMCPVCKKPLTRGVLNRVNELADREEGVVPEGAIGYKSLIPLMEIIAEAKGVDKKSKAVEKEYLRLIEEFGSEFTLLLDIAEEELRTKLGGRIAHGIEKVRAKQVEILPGFDGEYGTLHIFKDGEESASETRQATLF